MVGTHLFSTQGPFGASISNSRKIDLHPTILQYECPNLTISGNGESFGMSIPNFSQIGGEMRIFLYKFG
jgi:hypothetical protein